MQVSMSILYLIPTPLSDQPIANVIPHYNVEVLLSITHFVVEEIRTARRFLRKIGYMGNFDEICFYLLNEHSSAAELPTLIAPLLQGNNMGLLSEAGTPCIADPGSQLVSLAHQHQIRVIPLSGPSSIFMALMASGFNGQQFRFLGYLPIDKSQRIATIKSLEKEATTLHNSQIFIETPYRNLSLFNDILRTCQSNTLLCIACNLTAENEFIQTKTIRQWETSAPNIHKINCVFIISS